MKFLVHAQILSMPARFVTKLIQVLSGQHLNLFLTFVLLGQRHDGL